MHIREAISRLIDSHERAVYQLAGIRCIGQAFQESPERRRPDHFLSSTVYSALCEALVVGIGTIWDDDKNSIAFGALRCMEGASNTKELAEYCQTLHRASQEKDGTTWSKIRMWRNKVVAHRSFRFNDPTTAGGVITFEEFGRRFSIKFTEVGAELDSIFSHLLELDRLAGIHRFRGVGTRKFDDSRIKEQAKQDAMFTVGRWRLGVLAEARLQASLPQMFERRRVVAYADILDYITSLEKSEANTAFNQTKSCPASAPDAATSAASQSSAPPDH